MGKPGNIKVFSFDFGGTLAYETTDDHIIFQKVLKELGYSFNQSEIKEAMKHARAWWEHEKDKRIWDENALKDFHKRMLSYLKLPNPEKLAMQTSKILPSKLDFKAYSDVEQTLQRLKEEGYTLIITSNVSSRRNLETYMRKAGLRHYFEILVASGSIGYEKPNPQIFVEAAKMAKVKCKEIVHVGDVYEIDYLGAESAGATGVLIDRKGKYVNKKCRKISDLTQLIELLNEINF